MGTKRKRRGRHIKQALTPTVRAILYDEPLPEPGDAEDFLDAVYLRGYDNPTDERCWANCLDLWRSWDSRVLADWIATRPGTRPQYWWLFDAPEPRQRLGGKGTEASGNWHGVPTRWDGPIDPRDPPTFESEAAYLKRLGLLEPDEAKALGRSRKAFAPVSLRALADAAPEGRADAEFVFDDEEPSNVVPLASKR